MAKKKGTSKKKAVKKTSGKKAIYKCATCGALTTEKGHLCNPKRVKAIEVYTCAFCGATSTDPWHICFPKLEKMKYYYGRVDVWRLIDSKSAFLKKCNKK